MNESLLKVRQLDSLDIKLKFTSNDTWKTSEKNYVDKNNTKFKFHQ